VQHLTLTSCLTALGLSACTSAPVGTPELAPRGPEPSGLDMGPAPTRASTRESEPRFVSETDHWCEVLIDTTGRKLEPTPSFLQAWNLVAAAGQRVMRYVSAPPQTEDDAHVRVCGRAECKLEQPQIVQAMTGGGAGARAGSTIAGFGVVLPTEQGMLVVPVAGTEGSCAVAPELRVERSGSLVHLTAIVHEGNYARYYFHGEIDERYGGHAPGYGGCQTLSSTRTDIVVDVANAQLELVLTQLAAADRLQPLIEPRLGPRGVELQGCAGVLELAWTT
jgi:hypothetical protein